MRKIHNNVVKWSICVQCGNNKSDPLKSYNLLLIFKNQNKFLQCRLNRIHWLLLKSKGVLKLAMHPTYTIITYFEAVISYRSFNYFRRWQTCFIYVSLNIRNRIQSCYLKIREIGR